MDFGYCYEQAKNSNPEAWSCLKGWLLKNDTSFVDNESLILNRWFGLLCFSYSLGGLIMITFPPSWTKHSGYPYILFGWILLLLQGPLSFAADYMNMTNHSIFHVIDRCFALFNLAMESTKIITMGLYVRPITFYLQICAILFAVFCFSSSSHYQHLQDPQRFVFWHNLWHTYPLISTCIHFFELYVADSLWQYDVIVQSEDVQKKKKKLS